MGDAEYTSQKHWLESDKILFVDGEWRAPASLIREQRERIDELEERIRELEEGE